MDDNESSMMDDLAEAWEASEGGDDAIQSEEPAVEASEQPAADEPAGTDELGAEPELVSAEGEGAEAAQAGDNAPAVEDKPPVGMPPEAREEWANTPKAVKDAIVKREADFASGVQKYAENANRAQQMDEALAPFQQLFAMNGGNATDTITGVLQTAAVLQMGSPVQRAQAVHNIIQQFGIDIQTLDRMIVGEPVPESVQQQQQMQNYIQQQMAPLQQQLQQYQQRDQQQAFQAEQKVTSEVEQFGADPKNEFFNDVRGDMADIMDMAHARGVQMTLKDAYERACQMHPTIGKILLARQGKNEVAQKSQAAASVHGLPSGAVGADTPDSLRGAIADAWDTYGQM